MLINRWTDLKVWAPPITLCIALPLYHSLLSVQPSLSTTHHSLHSPPSLPPWQFQCYFLCLRIALPTVCGKLSHDWRVASSCWSLQPLLQSLSHPSSLEVNLFSACLHSRQRASEHFPTSYLHYVQGCSTHPPNFHVLVMHQVDKEGRHFWQGQTAAWMKKEVIKIDLQAMKRRRIVRSAFRVRT